MFDFIKDTTVSMMLRLSSEHIGELQQNDFNDIKVDHLFDLCREHELDGVVASHLLNNPVIPLPDFWRQAYEEEKKRLAFLKEKASMVCAEMKRNNIPMIILKNGGIMADIIDDPAACPMEDIDSLVRKQDFMRAHQILLDCGFVFKFRSEFEKEKLNDAFNDGSTEYYFISQDGKKMWFELSWRPVAGRWIRLDKEPNSNTLFQDFYYAKDSVTGILSPENNLLQVCVHTAKHSYLRSPGLRLHLDVERIVTHKPINWELFLKKVEETHVKTSSYYSLLIPKVLFGTEVPQGVLDVLRPKQSKDTRITKLIAKANLLHPNQKKFSKIKFLVFQTSLYDSWCDAWKVLYPSWDWYKEKYHVNRLIFFPYCLLMRGLDLAGIRLKK